MTILQWKRVAETKIDSYAQESNGREIVVKADSHHLYLLNGKGGKVLLPLLTEVNASLGNLTNDIGAWSKAELTKVSQLTNDSNFWSSATLTKVSQLTNDSGYKTGYCTHCTYCAHCQQCSNCHNCTTVQCTTIKCTTVDCTNYSYCNKCDCRCADDS